MIHIKSKSLKFYPDWDRRDCLNRPRPTNPFNDLRSAHFAICLRCYQFATNCTLAAKTFLAALVTAPGAIGPAIISLNRSIVSAMEFLSPAEMDRGIEIAGGSAMAVSLTNSLQAAYTVSSSIVFEEL